MNYSDCLQIKASFWFSLGKCPGHKAHFPRKCNEYVYIFFVALNKSYAIMQQLLANCEHEFHVIGKWIHQKIFIRKKNTL